MAARRFTKSPIQGAAGGRPQRQQQLQHDLADGGQRIAARRMALQQQAHQQQVMKMPIRVEAEALQMAAGMLPRAMR
jgi:hypothetical protein